MIDSSGHFFLVIVFFIPTSRDLVAYHLERGGMLLHDAVGANCKIGATTDIKTQVPRTWPKGCMLDNCACVNWLDMTIPLFNGGRMSLHIIITIPIYQQKILYTLTFPDEIAHWLLWCPRVPWSEYPSGVWQCPYMPWWQWLMELMISWWQFRTPSRYRQSFA